MMKIMTLNLSNKYANRLDRLVFETHYFRSCFRFQPANQMVKRPDIP
jgi:predicted transcriptional regulator